jgi:hypothetical protein
VLVVFNGSAKEPDDDSGLVIYLLPTRTGLLGARAGANPLVLQRPGRSQSGLTLSQSYS